jgi:sugar phosphate isomerase/epimerase
VGCPGITLLPGVIWEELGPDASFDLAAQALGELVDLGRSAGLRVSIEPHLESVVEEPERALRLVEAVPGLQFTLDYTHFVAAGIPPERVHPLVPYAGHVHARQGAPGMLQASHNEGTIDYADIIRRLAAAGYGGFLSVEYTWQEWRGCNRLDVLSESVLLRDSLRDYARSAQQLFSGR